MHAHLSQAHKKSVNEKALLIKMRDEPKNEALQAKTLMQLASSSGSGARLALIDGGIKTVAAAMKNHPKSTGVQSYGAQVLGSTAQPDTVAGQGGVDAIVAALRMHSTSSSVVKNALDALKFLITCSRACLERFLVCGGVDALAGVLAGNLKNVDVLSAVGHVAMVSFAAVVADQPGGSSSNNGGVSAVSVYAKSSLFTTAVVDALRENPNSDKVQNPICIALCKVTAIKDAKTQRRYLECGAAEIIAKAAARSASRGLADLAVNASGVLQNITFHRFGAGRPWIPTVVEAMFSMMESLPNDEDAQCNGCGTLRNIAKEGQKVFADAVSTAWRGPDAAITATLRALCGFLSNAEIQENALFILAALIEGSENDADVAERVLKKGSLAAAAAAQRKFPNSTAIAGCGLRLASDVAYSAGPAGQFAVAGAGIVRLANAVVIASDGLDTDDENGSNYQLFEAWGQAVKAVGADNPKAFGLLGNVAEVLHSQPSIPLATKLGICVMGEKLAETQDERKIWDTVSLTCITDSVTFSLKHPRWGNGGSSNGKNSNSSGIDINKHSDLKPMNSLRMTAGLLLSVPEVQPFLISTSGLRKLIPSLALGAAENRDNSTLIYAAATLVAMVQNDIINYKGDNSPTTITLIGSTAKDCAAVIAHIFLSYAKNEPSSVDVAYTCCTLLRAAIVESSIFRNNFVFSCNGASLIVDTLRTYIYDDAVVGCCAQAAARLVMDSDPAFREEFVKSHLPDVLAEALAVDRTAILNTHAYVLLAIGTVVKGREDMKKAVFERGWAHTISEIIVRHAVASPLIARMGAFVLASMVENNVLNMDKQAHLDIVNALVALGKASLHDYVVKSYVTCMLLVLRDARPELKNAQNTEQTS